MIWNYDLNFSKFANLAGDLDGILIVAVDSDPLNGSPESKARIRLGRPVVLVLGKYLADLLTAHAHTGISHMNMKASINNLAGDFNDTGFSLKPDAVINTVLHQRLKDELWNNKVLCLFINIVLVFNYIAISEFLKSQIIFYNAHFS